MKLNAIKEYYKIGTEKRDLNRIKKIVELVNNGCKPNNYYDEIRKFTKNVYSDHAISQWQRLAEYFEKYI